jgi:hypothetical protein
MELIRKMSVANPRWGAPRIHGELLKLGFELSKPQLRSTWCALGSRPRRRTWFPVSAKEFPIGFRGLGHENHHGTGHRLAVSPANPSTRMALPTRVMEILRDEPGVTGKTSPTISAPEAKG